MYSIFIPVDSSLSLIIQTDFYNVFQHGNQQYQDSSKENIQIECPGIRRTKPTCLFSINLNSVFHYWFSRSCSSANLGGFTLSPEASAIYLSMKNSNLECIDENNQYHMSADVSQVDEDVEEYDDFDPYFFIKNLPDLSSVVPTFRPLLLPKQTRSCPSTTLVLDLDGKIIAFLISFSTFFFFFFLNPSV